MGYGEVDHLAINTIRILAVSLLCAVLSTKHCRVAPPPPPSVEKACPSITRALPSSTPSLTHSPLLSTMFIETQRRQLLTISFF